MDSDSIIAAAFEWHDEAAHADPIVVHREGMALREEVQQVPGNGQRWLTWTKERFQSISPLSAVVGCLITVSTRDLQKTRFECIVLKS